MNKSKVVLAGVAVATIFGVIACKRSDPTPDSVKAADVPVSEVKAEAPTEDKSPEYVKDLRKDEQKARDVGVVEQKAVEAEAKTTDEATK